MALLVADVSATQASSPDFDGDGKVGFPDFLLFLGAFGSSDPSFDLSDNGTVDFQDFLLFVAAYGTIAEGSASDTSATDCGNDVGNGLEIISGPSGPEGDDRDNPFRALTIHPNDPNTLLVGTERNGFVKSTDGGQTWERFRSGLRHHSGLYPEVWNVSFAPSDPRIVYAATLDSPGPVTGDYPSSVGGIYKSQDGGENWTRLNCGLYNSRATAVAVDPQSSEIVLVGIEGGAASFSDLKGQYFDGGIYKTQNGGESWEAVTLPENSKTNGYWRILSRGGVFFTFGLRFENLSDNLGFLASQDSGTTWSSLTDSLRTQMITGFDVSSDGQTLYANPRDSFRMHISTDGGISWKASSINQANGPVAVSPIGSQLVIYAGQNTIYRSTDGLVTQSVVLEAEQQITDIQFSLSDPTTVYAIAMGYLLYKSTDAGLTFELITNIRTEVLNEQP